MDYETMLGLILDTGTELIRCGGETHRVEDTLYRLARGYGFTACNFWVVPSNIQATLTTPAGEVRTQIRHVDAAGIDFLVLDRLNALSRWACAEKPGPEVFRARLEEIRQIPPQRRWVRYLACGLGGWGFSLFFGCDLYDSLVALLASFLVVFLEGMLSKREGNPLILNFVVSFLTELFILLLLSLGLGSHLGFITAGVIMLLISGLGTTNGLRDLVHLDTLSGVMNITASFTGAIGITLGVALPLLLFRNGASEVPSLNSNLYIQFFGAVVACVGFSLWFRVTGRKMVFCALGALLTWGVYRLAEENGAGTFTTTLISAIFCGLYGQFMARVNKTPATIFTTICILPIIPGACLYFAMHGVVFRNLELAHTKGTELGLTCFGIVLGYMVVEVVNRYIWRRPVGH